MCSDLLKHKPVDSRKRRPAWSMDDQKLMLHCVGERPMLRYKIALMYWRQNMTAKDIAEALDMNTPAVEMILVRLSRS
jgi:hypothetical protein